MVHRDIEADILPLCREHGISMLSYSSLALGLLTGKIGPERTFEGDDLRISDPRFSIDNRRRTAAFALDVQPLASALGITIAELVIAWTLAQPGITFALCGARNPGQARENARAGTVALTQSDLAAIDAAAGRHLAGIHA
jgi:aryl-alcohol dehydrogenase-like predicted oxidoreductase